MNNVHIALNSYHFDEAVAFYSEIFLTKPIKLTSDYAKFAPDLAPINLTLARSKEPVTGSKINHFGIQVFDQDHVQQAINQFKQASLETVVEDDVNCCYARQDKVWVKDPDDNSWEFFFVAEQL